MATKAGDASVPAASRPSDGVNVVWHKWSDLRLLDHEPLWHAHAKPGPVLHVHLVELPLLSGQSRVGKVPRCSARRAEFWRQSVEDLAIRLEERGQQLVVEAVEDPSTFFAALCEQIPVSGVYAHREFCEEELETEAAVRRALSACGAELHTFWGALTVHHIDDLGFDARSRSEMPMYKGEFQRAAKRRPIREVLPIPTLRKPPENYRSRSDIEQAFASGLPQPPPEERQVFRWQGGETAGLEHLRNYIDSGQLASYRGATESFAHGEENPVNSGTRLSPWLAFGCLSARMVIKEAREYERRHGKTSSGKGIGKIGSTGTRLHTELLFRDFLRFSALAWGTSLFKIGGPFHVQGLEWSRDMELFRKWREGQTGFPFVDAGMRELAATGYISHLHRQCCAAFLVRDLRLDWRMGAEHFESCLLDHTPDANWGNWAYRILQRPCLVETRAKYPVEEHITTVEVVAWPAVHDARLDHTLRWCPELRKLPKDLAREPWLTDTVPEKRISIRPYKDSPLWFCAANRTNWDYEYFWLPGHAWTVKPGKSEAKLSDFHLGRDYPRPIVPPLNVELDLDILPVKFHSWGTEPAVRQHIWGGSKRPDGSTTEGKGKSHGKGGGKGSGKRSGKGQGSQGHVEGWPPSESLRECRNPWQKRRHQADWQDRKSVV